MAMCTADGPAIHKYLKKKLGKSQLPPMPQVWVAGTYLGGVDGVPLCLPEPSPARSVRLCGACGALCVRPERRSRM